MDNLHNLTEKLRQARETSWKHCGKTLTVYLPGMFSLDGLSGAYPAISITGSDCALQCDHCCGTTLQPMISAMEPSILLEKSLDLAKKGSQGILISGGCDRAGRLPWEGFLPAIAEIRKSTDLYISIHCGLLDGETAFGLKDAGVDQALLDVIGDNETFQGIYHVEFGVSRISETMKALSKAELPMVPHVVCGLHYGEIRGEKNALEMISRYPVEQLVIVSLMAIPGTPFGKLKGPSAEEIGEIIAQARWMMPRLRMSLGCARRRGDTQTELLAIDGGINRMALPSEEALDRAREYGLEIRYQRTCCSVSRDTTKEDW
ncbi:MAG: radical SAM protein [Deltaproteobacteria bacterium]|nr:radical SAM protein [Deltaproteobacteria bacterium]